LSSSGIKSSPSNAGDFGDFGGGGNNGGGAKYRNENRLEIIFQIFKVKLLSINLNLTLDE
jgi:hypothetical protein